MQTAWSCMGWRMCTRQEGRGYMGGRAKVITGECVNNRGV